MAPDTSGGGGGGEADAGARQGACTRTDHCALGCGRVYHTRCLVRWFGARGPHARQECPVCRAAWRRDGSAAAAALAERAPPADAQAEGDADEVLGGDGGGEAFLNLAMLQPGTQRVRDTSTYSSWLGVHQRRRDQHQLTQKVSRSS